MNSSGAAQARPQRPWALVTGATSGIGLALAQQLAAHRHDLVLVSRSAEALANLGRELESRAGVSVQTRAADLSEPGGARELWNWVEAESLTIEILVNNAGAGLHGDFSAQSVDAIERLIALNVAALTSLTRRALPAMLARRSGRILNLASVVAFQPGGPQEAVYYATKAYVLSFSRGLATELKGSGVTVTALCPGPTRTGFEAAAGARGTAAYRWLASTPAAEVARAGYQGMMRGKAVVIPGAIAKLIAFAGQWSPRRVALEVNRILFKSREGGSA